MISKKLFKKTTLIQLLIALCLSFSATFSQANSLLAIEYNKLQPNSILFAFQFNENIAQEPQIKVLHKPLRLELLFAAQEYDKQLNNSDINHANVNQIMVSSAGEQLRVEVLLEHLNLYQGRLDGNQYFLEVGKQLNVAANNAGDMFNRLVDLDFRSGSDEQGQMLVFLDNNMSVIDVQEKIGKIAVQLYNTEIPEDLLYKLDVTDFGTVVKHIETFRDGKNVRIEVEPAANYEFEHQQMNNIFSLLVKKSSKKTGLLEEKGNYQGKAISLNFQDISVRTVLQIIADYNGFNLVTSDTVTGNITLRLDGVPWDQALDLILKVKGLGKRMEGNILLVAPSEELAAREAQDLQSQQQVQELSPLYSEYLQINYAKAADFANLLNTEGASLLSERGTVSVDERTNTLLIRDTAQSINDVTRMIKVLDVPVRQVIIESRMVTVKDNITEELGIRWGITHNGSDTATSGSLEGADKANSGVVPSLDERLNVNLPVVSPAGTLAFQVARLADGTILDLELSAMEQENKGEVIASPRITTANQKEAYIEQGTEIPFVEAASSGATSVTFKKAVLGLKVTPHITPDNRIILDLIITQDTRGDTVPTATGPATAIDTQEIATQVLVNNGETIVLGGIYQQQIVNTVSKVPVLGDIPYFGWLFRNSREFNEKKELLIFVTPRIVTEQF